MGLSLELALVLLLVLGLGVWGIVSGLRQSRAQSRPAVSAQALSALAQPYRHLLGEAVAIQSDIAKQAKSAPRHLQGELGLLQTRVEDLVRRALPRAQHGTSLSAYLLELRPDEAQYGPTREAAARVERELSDFTHTLKTLRGKVYQVLTDATDLSADAQLSRDLHDALIDVEALEEAFSEVRQEA